MHADYYTELHQLSGCKTVTITANIKLDSMSEGPIQLLCGDADSDCPLDIIAELKVCTYKCILVCILLLEQ